MQRTVKVTEADKYSIISLYKVGTPSVEIVRLTRTTAPIVSVVLSEYLKTVEKGAIKKRSEIGAFFNTIANAQKLDKDFHRLAKKSNKEPNNLELKQKVKQIGDLLVAIKPIY